MRLTLGRDIPQALRRLAQLSVLFAVACALATVVALARLPYAAASGQWIVIAGGALAAVAVFAFGVAVSLRKPAARRIGFVAVAGTFVTAALYGLLALVVPESSLVFLGWTAVLLAYAAFTTHRLVHWPTMVEAPGPKLDFGLFISYRHEDSRETVGRIHDHLRRHFREDCLFQDVIRQVAGEDYRVAIGSALERAEVVLAVIGPQWLSVTDREGARRIDDPNDLVRLEIESALEHDLRVIPVLVQGADMPGAGDLPPALHPLCYRVAAQLRPDPDFQSDMERLVDELRARSPAEGS